ncbi:MAG: ABC transporter substrate-binding protein [Clostridia bacterium]|jgi:iron complex transport system substrate-binding protein|nr:ABC transporter substrate-binding protein [Clostridia bacterium]
MTRRMWIVISLMMLAITLSGCNVMIGGTKSGTSIIDEDTFVDDVGNLIELDGPYTRIVSLYRDHTENLFVLGAGASVIGVDRSSVFPSDVSELPRYSLDIDYDAQAIVDAQPDLVLVAPIVNKEHSAFVTKLETAGLLVVSLLPESFEEFDIYIEKLAMLTGKQGSFGSMLDDFYAELNAISLLAATASKRQNVFFEISESGCKTASPKSLCYIAMEYAGGSNIAHDARPEFSGVTSAPYGLEKIFEKAGEIDVYLTLQGVRDPGSSLVSIAQRKAFDDVKAVQDDRVYEIDGVVISAYTFRFATGVGEIARYLYPEIFDSLDSYKNDEVLDRETFVQIVVKYYHTPIFTNSSADYYEFEKYNHTYGKFIDVVWQDEDFDVIETAVMRSYISGFENSDGQEHFDRSAAVTRSDIASFLYILYDTSAAGYDVQIEDISDIENAQIIKKVVGAGLMDTQDGYFYPNGTMTNNEFIEFLNSLGNR